MRSKTNLITIFILLAVILPFTLRAQTRTIVFPVDGETSFRNDFLEPRDGGAREHLGTDIIAPKHTPLVAAVNGVISYIPFSEPSWGYMLTIQDSEGYQYRYLHLNNDNRGTDDGNGGSGQAYASGLKRGTKVSAGQLVGWVGDSGNAENTVPHLHFEIRGPDRVAINPYSSLVAAASPENYKATTAIVEHESSGDAGVEEGASLIFTIEIREGMQGYAIKELQRRLEKAGHFTHPTLTKYFGPITKASLQSFQQANGIAPTGVLGYETRAILNDDPVALSGRIKLEKELFEGDKDQAVLQVELKLKALGYFHLEADEEFDSTTREAVRSFQRSSGLSTTGYVSYDTWNNLNNQYKATSKPAIVTTPIAGPTENTPSGNYVFTSSLSIGSRGNDVVELQCFLQKLGYFSENTLCTGYFGPITHEAVAKFQASKGIESIGIVGPKTRAALNSI